MSKIKEILEKYARVIYFDRSNTLEELESIKEAVDKLGYEYSLFREALLYSTSGNIDKALEVSDHALNIAYTNDNAYLIQEISMYRGVLYRSMNQSDEAFKSYLVALKHQPSARAYNNMADLFLIEGDYEEADKYLRRALELLLGIDKKTFFELRLLNIVYTNLSEAELKSGRTKAALQSANNCIELAEETGDLFTRAYGHDLMGNILVSEGNYEEAMTQYHIAEDIYKSCDVQSRTQVKVYIDDNMRFQSKCLCDWGKYHEAIDHIKALDQMIAKDYELLVAIYEILGDTRNKSIVQDQYFQFIVSEKKLRNETRRDNFKTKVKIFESEKKANQYELLYKHTKSMSGIGRDIIAAEKLDDVLFAVYRHIDQIMKFDTLALAKVQNDKIDYNWVLENHQRVENFSVDIHNYNSFTSWVVRNKKSIRINDTLTKDELKKYKRDAEMTYIGSVTGSMILCPIMMKDTVYGVLNIQSKDRYKYSEYDLEVLNMLASFIAVAMKHWDDASALRQANEKLEALSKTDALTGISNRHNLSEIVEDIFKSDKTQMNISVVMIDIDFFKEYNDTYGHIDGDRCIISIVDVLRRRLDQGDNRLFRYGGDEFVAIIPFLKSEEVFELLEKTRNEIEALKIENKYSKASDYVTCTFGYTTVNKGSMDYQKVFYIADEAMYHAKSQGKNCIVEKTS